MVSVNVEYNDLDTVFIRIAPGQFFGLAVDEWDPEWEDKGLEGGCVTIAELCLRPKDARTLLLALAEALVLVENV